MNDSEIKRIFPRASKDFADLNADGISRDPKPQSVVRNERLDEKAGKAKNAIRHIVRITSFRTRLLDTDNLCPKFFIDALRYAGCIYDDAEKDIDLRVSQRQVEKRTQEKTLIEIL